MTDRLHLLNLHTVTLDKKYVQTSCFETPGLNGFHKLTIADSNSFHLIAHQYIHNKYETSASFSPGLLDIALYHSKCW